MAVAETEGGRVEEGMAEAKVAVEMAEAEVVMPVVAAMEVVVIELVESSCCSPAGRSKPKGQPSCNTSCSCQRRTSRSLSRSRRLRCRTRPHIRSSGNPRT